MTWGIIYAVLSAVANPTVFPMTQLVSVLVLPNAHRHGLHDHASVRLSALTPHRITPFLPVLDFY